MDYATSEISPGNFVKATCIVSSPKSRNAQTSNKRRLDERIAAEVDLQLVCHTPSSSEHHSVEQRA